jgi:Protein of unknown function with PCYCGC motif
MRSIASVAFIVVLGMIPLLNDNEISQRSDKTTNAERSPAYHDGPPAEPIPATLDARLFRKNRSAFVAYTLAGQTREILYQVPCYCGCDKSQGHKSLLDCFTGEHGVLCRLCQKELLFCYQQHQKRKSPNQIRLALAEGKAADVNLPKLTDRFYKQMAASKK